MTRTRRFFTGELAKHLFLIGVLLLVFYPLFLMVMVSLKTNEQYANNPWFFDAPRDWHWQNWATAWGQVKGYIANSIVTATLGTAIAMLLTILSSYVIARYRFFGRDALYYVTMGCIFLPGSAASLVTLFDLLQRMQLLNTLWALILVGGASGQVLGIYIIKQYIEELPKALFEAAEMEGAGHVRQIFDIVLPLSGPILVAVAMMQFMNMWNEVILPMTVLRDNQTLTLTVGLMRMEGEYVKNWGELMASYSIAAVPLVILFLFMNQIFMRGATSGGALRQ